MPNTVFTDLEADNITADTLTVNGVAITPVDTDLKVDKVALAAVRTAGGVLAWQNPTGASIIVTSVVLDITTASTGASTIDVGYTATSATTSSDTIIDGVSGASIAVVDSQINAGTNGVGPQKVAAGKWITASEASGDVTGLVGSAYIYYHLA